MSKKQDSSKSSIVTLAKEFKDMVELRNFCNAQHETISKLTEKLTQLEQENVHLKTLLISTNDPLIIKPSIQQIQGNIPPEEIICAEQISKLQEISRTRILTLDEVKRLDLLVKNLRMIKDRSPDGKDDIEDGKYVDELSLLQIASKSDGSTEQ